MASAAPVAAAGAGATADACPHLNMVRKTQGYTVFKDECTQCFENDLSPTGVDLCLTCFNGGCAGANKHAQRHHAVSSHPIVLNIRKRELKKPDEPAKPAAAAADAPAGAGKDKDQDKDKDADKVVVKAEEPKYDYEYKCTCLTCKVELSLANSTIAATLKQVQEAEAKAAADTLISLGGDGPVVACSHTANLKQIDKHKAPQIASKATAHCARCELGIKTGLWMCLTCGALGCAREQYGGTGGRSHGVAHNKDTGHPLVVKLDTIKPDKAEVFCYACGDMVDDSKHLQQHLATFGLVLSEQQSEGKTMAEILAAANNNLNLLSITDGGAATEAKELCFGPGFTGLENLGNTCYMASVAQVLFALPSFYKRYYIDGKEHIKTCRSMRPGECYQCQLSKLGCGLNSGEYSKAPVDWKGKPEQKGAAAGSGAGAAPVPGQGAVVMIKQDPGAASAPGDKRKPPDSADDARPLRRPHNTELAAAAAAAAAAPVDSAKPAAAAATAAAAAAAAAAPEVATYALAAPRPPSVAAAAAAGSSSSSSSSARSSGYFSGSGTAVDSGFERVFNELGLVYPPGTFVRPTAALAQLHKLEQHGIRPKAFRKLVAAGNPDFLSSRQQDAFEYLQHFIQQLNQKERRAEDNPTTTFDFRFENRTQCGTCKRVKYQSEKAADVQLPVPVDQKALDAQNAQAKEQHLKNEADKKRREAEKAAREKAETAAAIAAVDAAVAKEVGATVAAVGAAAPAGDSAPAAPSTAGKPEDKPKPVELPPVQFEECVAQWAKVEHLERYNCPDCKSAQPATKATKFETFPETLIVQMRRFVQTDWTFRKLNVDVVVPKEFDFAPYLGKGLQANEQLMAGAAAPGAPPAPPKPDAAIVAQLESMGMFTKNACMRAAVAVKNASADAAMEWALAHGEDADINDPLPEPKPAAAAAPAGPAVPEELVQQVLMILEGLPVARVRHALQKTGNNVERAVDYAMSHMDEPLPGDEKAGGAAAGGAKKPTAAELKSKFRLWAAITHQGAGPGTGHYVAHVLKEGKWCLFNDQRVTVEDKPKLEQAYILLFRKVA